LVLVARAVVASNLSKIILGRKTMNRRSLITRVAAALAALMLSGAIAHAAEVKVLTSVALKSVLDELAPVFEKKTGDKLVIDYGLAAELKKRIEGGERADLIILTRAMMEDLLKQNKLTADGLVNIAGTPVAVAARAGAAKPDIRTVEAFKAALLATKSIVYADPAKGGLSGVVAARAIERLGIAEQMKAKTILVPGAQSGDVVAKGEAELGIAQASEIVPVAGAQLVGPLPGELAVMTRFTGGIGAESGSVPAVKALIEFLTGPEAAPSFKAKGFEAG
jgi:molybdate transport system substrate-binding protein